jgi:hypothetical protein
VDEHEAYLEMRLKIGSVFEHYAAQSEYYMRANIGNGGCLLAVKYGAYLFPLHIVKLSWKRPSSTAWPIN